MTTVNIENFNNIGGNSHLGDVLNNGINGKTTLNNPSDNPHWVELLNSMHNFREEHQYVLLLDEGICSDKISNLTAIYWRLIIDFDPDSCSKGIYKQVSPQYSENHALHTLAHGDKYCKTPYGSNWYFVKGIAELETTLFDNEYKEWRRKYKADMDLKFKELANSNFLPTTAFVMLSSAKNYEYILTTLEILEEIFDERLNIVCMLPNNDSEVRDKFNRTLFNIQYTTYPLDGFLDGIISTCIKEKNQR